MRIQALETQWWGPNSGEPPPRDAAPPAWYSSALAWTSAVVRQITLVFGADVDTNGPSGAEVRGPAPSRWRVRPNDLACLCPRSPNKTGAPPVLKKIPELTQITELVRPFFKWSPIGNGYWAN